MPHWSGVSLSLRSLLHLRQFRVSTSKWPSLRESPQLHMLYRALQNEIDHCDAPSSSAVASHYSRPHCQLQFRMAAAAAVNTRFVRLPGFCKPTSKVIPQARLKRIYLGMPDVQKQGCMVKIYRLFTRSHSTYDPSWRLAGLLPSPDLRFDAQVSEAIDSPGL